MPAADVAWYFAGGTELFLSKGHAIHGSPTAYWPIGYPAFLGLLFLFTGPSVFAAKQANVGLSLGILALAYLLSKRLFNYGRTGRITLLIRTFYPNYVAYSSLLLSEILFTFLLLLGSLDCCNAQRPKEA